MAVGAVWAGTTAAAHAAVAAAGQPVDGGAHLEGGAELHAEPAREVLLGQEGERAAVDTLLPKGLKRTKVKFRWTRGRNINKSQIGIICI